MAIEAIKGYLTANEIASEYEVHVTQVNSWKKQLLSNAGELFGRGAEKQQAEHEHKSGKLYEEIGRLKVYEEIYLNEYRDVSHLKQSLKKYFHFYNTERPHQSLGYRTPVESDRRATHLPMANSI